MFLLISVWSDSGWHGRHYLDWFQCFCRSGDDEGKAVDCWQFSVLVYILLLHLEGLEAKENANQAVKFMALRAAINQQLTQCFL